MSDFTKYAKKYKEVVQNKDYTTMSCKVPKEVRDFFKKKKINVSFMIRDIVLEIYDDLKKEENDNG